MYKTILENDIKYMKKDPMVWMLFLTPIIFVAVYQLLVLRIELLAEYKPSIQYMFVVLIPFMIGMVLGFRMLDEKDEHMLEFYAVSPLGFRGYIFMRVTMALILGIISVVGISLFGVLPREYSFFVGLQTVLLAPLIFLILGIIGKNKIQGLTLVKIMGMVFMLPVLKTIKENPLDKIFVFIPSYNIFQLIVNKEFNYGVPVYIGVLCISIYLFINSFNRKCISEI